MLKIHASKHSKITMVLACVLMVHPCLKASAMNVTLTIVIPAMKTVSVSNVLIHSLWVTMETLVCVLMDFLNRMAMNAFVLQENSITARRITLVPSALTRCSTVPNVTLKISVMNVKNLL